MEKKYCTRDELLERTRTVEKEKDVPGIGLVKYRTLGFSEQQNLLKNSDGNDDYAARGIIFSFIAPAFTIEDLPLLKAGAFGPMAMLAKLPFEDIAQGPIREDDLEKPKGS